MFRLKITRYTHFFIQQCSSLSYFTVKEALNIKPVDTKILVKGWVQAVRSHKDLYFVDLTDGTCLDRLQIIIPSDCKECPTYGSSIKVEGCLTKSSHKGQEVELVADNWSTYGLCPPEDYPFKKHQVYSEEYIRQYPHLRARTKKISSILRIRNVASMAADQFFQDRSFFKIHTPIITRNDCEGAGEVFSVQIKQTPDLAVSADTSSTVSEACKLKQNVSEASHSDDLEDYFSGPAYLTVSGQFHLEAMACALSRVYCFGPVFRAENSRTRQHASEFQMIEAEMAFIETLEDLIKIVETCIKHIAKSVFENCQPEIQFLNKSLNNKEEYLKKFISEPFIILSYNEAMEILEKNKSKLKVPIKNNNDFPADHKNCLVKYCNDIPVFVTMFPSSLKPFYMKTDEKKKESYCFDLFALFGGEICGGSLRENDEQALKKHPLLQNNHLSWYLDIRRYGSVPHGGFGIGFDRLLQSILGISNIRDIIPFPRRKFDCKC